MTPEALASLHRAGFTVPRPWRAEEFAGFLADPHCDLIPHDHGFALIRTLAGEAELLTIAVDPAHRRKGIARGLMGAALDRAAARGAEAMFLEVAAGNAGAIALYQASGFRRNDLRPAYYACPDGTRADAVLMARNLTSGTVAMPESG